MKQMDPTWVPGPPLGDPQSSLVALLSLSEATEATGERRSDQVSRRELRLLFPVSDMTIWRWMGDPEVAFPRPVKFGQGSKFLVASRNHRLGARTGYE